MSMGRAVSVDTLPPPRLLGRRRRRRREAGEIALPRHRRRVGAVADLQSPVLRRDQQTSLSVQSAHWTPSSQRSRPFSTIAYRLSPGTPERNAANQPCTASATAPSVFGRAFCIVTGRLSSHVSPGLRGSVSTVSVHPRRRSTANDAERRDRKSTRLNSSHSQISYAVFCLKKKTHISPGSEVAETRCLA